VALTISTDVDGALVVIHAAGDIDYSTADAWEHAITAALGDTTASAVLLDLNAVTVLDSTGISALVRQQRRARAADVDLRVIRANTAVRHVLELTGVWDYLSGMTRSNG